MVEQTPRNQNSDADISINRLVDAIAQIATQQGSEAATMLKPIPTTLLIFDGKNEIIRTFRRHISHNAQSATRGDGSHENQPVP